MRSYILYSAPQPRHLPPPQHNSDRRPYLQRPEDVSETNAEQLGGRYANESLVGDNQNLLKVTQEVVLFPLAAFCRISARVPGQSGAKGAGVDVALHAHVLCM